MPYRDLQDILTLTAGWEKELKDLYDVAEIALRDEKSRKVVALLRDKLVKTSPCWKAWTWGSTARRNGSGTPWISAPKISFRRRG